MRHPAATVLAIFALLFSGLGQARAAAVLVPTDSEVFVAAMLRGMGAERTDCPDEVVESARTHAMNAVCARYEGSFARFYLRWDLVVARQVIPGNVEAESDWQSSGSTHDRIYRVGETAVGVRFDGGDVVMVW